MVLAALTVIGERGLTIGKDISLVTVDDSAWLDAIVPGITVIQRPVDQLAELAVRKLAEQIEEKNPTIEDIILPTKLIARGSIAKLN
jgi:LacI family transcriptional regulator